MDCDSLWEIFQQLELDFFTGVPDSTFKGWMSFLSKFNGIKLTNIIACNECEAIAIATGYHLATSKIAVAYMQNAGEGKTINPLTSLCDPEVYSVPVFLMIGWRGEPETTDEPQHKKMGKITTSLLDLLGIPFKILPDSIFKAKEVIELLYQIALTESIPVALLIQRGTIHDYNAESSQDEILPTREEVLKIIADFMDDCPIVTTTGKTSRELYEHRVFNSEETRDFYTVGGMGCSASIGLGIALQKPNTRIIVIDGDGSLLMQLGSLATIGHYKPPNLIHFLIDNNSHESTGGQPTVSNTVDFEKIALSCGYEKAISINSVDDLKIELEKLITERKLTLIIIKVKKGARSNLGRPTTTPKENKRIFMNYLKK